MKTNRKFVEKIGEIYFEKYRTVGFDDAAKYADLIIGDNEELMNEVREYVEKRISDTMRRGR